MCLAFPGKIISLHDDGKATVDFDGVKKRINTFFVPEVKEGEYVAVHAGFAIQVLTKEDGLEALEVHYGRKKDNNTSK